MAGKSLLDEVLHSSYGKTKIDEIISIMQTLIEGLATITYTHIARVIPSFEKQAIQVNKPAVKWVRGELTIGASIQLADAALHRPSLNSNLYPAGVDNIVLLLTRGYKARHAIRGTWHGEEWLSRPEREGDSFLADAIRDFKTQYDHDIKRLGLDVMIADKYNIMS